MAYKFKPNKSVAKRFGVSKTGKLKHRHTKTSHLMSARTSAKKRQLGRPAILFEGHAKNMRKLMGIGGMHPAQTQVERELAQKKAGAATVAAAKPDARNQNPE